MYADDAQSSCLHILCVRTCFTPKLSLSLWSLLPEEVTNCTSVVGFKRHLKQSDIQLFMYIVP